MKPLFPNKIEVSNIQRAKVVRKEKKTLRKDRKLVKINEDCFKTDHCHISGLF